VLKYTTGTDVCGNTQYTSFGSTSSKSLETVRHPDFYKHLLCPNNSCLMVMNACITDHKSMCLQVSEGFTEIITSVPSVSFHRVKVAGA
jgi:hypothetical protein